MAKPVEALSKAVLKRLGMAESTTPCMMFSSQSMLGALTMGDGGCALVFGKYQSFCIARTFWGCL